MNVLVCGASGCVGAAVVQALRVRGHRVIEGTRCAEDSRRAMRIDYMQPVTPEAWAKRLRAADVDAVVNCVGILMPSRRQSFERVHAHGPIELFRGAVLAGVQRIVQVSALGVDGDDPDTLATPYLHSKLLADDALAALPLDGVVLRPSLIYGPRSQSAALFATLASLPVIGLPGLGAQRVQPIHVYELAEAIARVVESRVPLHGVHELGGPSELSYREMLERYRHALGLAEPVWLPTPMLLMHGGAWLAEALPQKVFCRDTVRLLQRGSVPRFNAAAALLGRPPTGMAQGLQVTPPEPMIDLRVQMSPVLERTMRASLAFMWLYTAGVTAWMPHESGVLRLLARCGLEGPVGLAAMTASCVLNVGLGVLTLLRPSPWVYAWQCAAVIGYTVTAAINMPELTIDHCGPLVKNLPVLALVLLMWMSRRPSVRGQAMRQASTPRSLQKTWEATPTLSP